MKLQIEQIPRLLELLKQGQHEYSDIVPEVYIPKVERFIYENIENPKALFLTNKQVTAVLILIVTPDYFSIKQSIRDLVFYSKTPGSGFRLLKEAQEWIDEWGNGIHEAYLGTSTSSPEVDDMLIRSGRVIKIGSQFKFNRKQ